MPAVRIALAAAALVIAAVSPASATQFGASNADELGFKPDVSRVYLDEPTSWAKVTGPSVVSFKLEPREVLNGEHDTLLRSWFRSAPPYRVWYSYWHEPENDMVTRRDQRFYRQAWRHIVTIERSVPRNRLSSSIIFMSYTLSCDCGREVAQFYPGNRWIDVLAFDGYNRPKDGGYLRPAAVYGPGYRVARAYGKPFGVGEWGSVVFESDFEGRAKWIESVGRYLSARGTRFATYWNQNSDRGWDYQLNDAPSRNALKGLMR
jgi:hypothetical protein